MRKRHSRDLTPKRPRALAAGDTIGIIAPAGPIEQREPLYQSIATLERFGFRVRYEERIFDSVRYLAGDDATRAAELTRYFGDPGIQAIIPLRGGYGCARLIPLLDEKRLRRHCKILMGFSDLTTLHLFFLRRFGWITLHGPMAMSAALAEIGPDAAKHLLALLTDADYRPHFSFPQLETWYPGVAEGKIVGGCLSLVASSLGTAYEIETEGSILFLEDLGEAPYRIDRMLTQLRLAGKLDSVAGVLLGGFHDCNPTEGNYTAAEVLREMLQELKIPTIANFPAGHGPENWAFPLGAQVRLDADVRRIQFLEAAVTRIEE